MDNEEKKQKEIQPLSEFSQKLMAEMTAEERADFDKAWDAVFGDTFGPFEKKQ